MFNAVHKLLNNSFSKSLITVGIRYFSKKLFRELSRYENIDYLKILGFDKDMDIMHKTQINNQFPYMISKLISAGLVFISTLAIDKLSNPHQSFKMRMMRGMMIAGGMCLVGYLTDNMFHTAQMILSYYNNDGYKTLYTGAFLLRELATAYVGSKFADFTETNYKAMKYVEEQHLKDAAGIGDNKTSDLREITIGGGIERRYEDRILQGRIQTEGEIGNIL